MRRRGRSNGDCRKLAARSRTDWRGKTGEQVRADRLGNRTATGARRRRGRARRFHQADRAEDRPADAPVALVVAEPGRVVATVAADYPDAPAAPAPRPAGWR